MKSEIFLSKQWEHFRLFRMAHSTRVGWRSFVLFITHTCLCVCLCVEVNLIYRRETHFPNTNKQYDFIIKSRTSYHLSDVHVVCILSNLCGGNQKNNVHENNFIKLLFTLFHITSAAAAAATERWLTYH